MGIKAVIFDWGGVLIDNPSKGLFKYCAKELDISCEIFKSSFSKYGIKFTKGLISEEQLFKYISRDLGITFSFTRSLWKEAVQNIFRDKKEVYQIVNELKKNGLKVGILSNTEIPTVEYFYEKGYDKYFDAAVFSCKENFAKPEKDIYCIMLKRLNVKPEETVFIDDSPKYIDGAKKAGLHGTIFEDISQLRKELKEKGLQA